KELVYDHPESAWTTAPSRKWDRKSRNLDVSLNSHYLPNFHPAPWGQRVPARRKARDRESGRPPRPRVAVTPPGFRPVGATLRFHPAPQGQRVTARGKARVRVGGRPPRPRVAVTPRVSALKGPRDAPAVTLSPFCSYPYKARSTDAHPDPQTCTH